MSYDIVKSLCKKIYGYEPSCQTVDRWRKGQNVRGKKLHTVKLGGRLMTTEEHLREFLEDREVETATKVTCQPKTRSVKARQKAMDQDNAVLNAFLGSK
jgi:hypothetical protein